MVVSNIAEFDFVDDKKLRDSFVDRTDVLDKVKVLSLLPDNEYMTTSMVADYYSVKIETLRQINLRNKDELTEDGIITLKGQDLKRYKKKIELHNVTLSAKTNLTLYNRRCTLRIGMLLRDSEVAKQVRTYLLNIEEQSNQQQKSIAVQGSSWDGKDLILYDIILKEMSKENGTLSNACQIASEKIGKTKSACQSRYNQKIKPIIQNEELKLKISANKKGVQLPISESYEEIPDAAGCKKPTWHELMLNTLVLEIEGVKSHIESINSDNVELLKSKASQMEKENEKLKRRINKLTQDRNKIKDELNSTRAVIGASIKLKVNEEISSTFKMDRNGNLERV